MDDQVPDSRSYVHIKCGEVTVVDGGDFRNVASPVPGMPRTMCGACGGMFPISEFKWEDSREKIISYYERYRERVPPLTRLLCSRQFSNVTLVIGVLAGVAVGVWSWNSLGAIWGIVIGIVSSLVGAIAGIVIWDAFGIRALSRALGVRDVRCLK